MNIVAVSPKERPSTVPLLNCAWEKCRKGTIQYIRAGEFECNEAGLQYDIIVCRMLDGGGRGGEANTPTDRSIKLTKVFEVRM